VSSGNSDELALKQRTDRNWPDGGSETSMGTGVSVAGPRLMSTRPQAVRTWLVEHGELVSGPVGIRRIGIGQSNITSIVTDAGGREWVLREPPPGTKQGNAHDVAREAGIIAALAGSGVPVPRVVGTGAGFFMMERVAGEPLESEDDAQAIDPSRRRELGLQVIKALALLHSLNPKTVGLNVPTTAYVERQIRRVSDAWLRVGSDCRHDTAWRAVRSRLLDRFPDPPGPTVVMHGDFRLSNLLVHDGRITAVLDWELCTVGDAMVDLAWLLDDWRSPDEPAISMPSPTRVGGFPSRAQLIDVYQNETGFRVDRLGYYRGFTQWRAASLLQGVLTRRRTGVMGSHGAIDPGCLDDSIATLLASAAVHLKE
jgi:aminoglycoside phosphotransferase (APT) family kinase protein